MATMNCTRALLWTLFSCGFSFFTSNVASAQEPESKTWKSREDVASSATVKYVETDSKQAVSDVALAAALGLDPASVQVDHNFGVAAQVGIFNQLGILIPTQGNSFVLMSSGIAAAGTGGLASPEPGTNIGTSLGAMNDLARIQIGPMTVPANQRSIRMDFIFLSAEYPEYVGSQFNDEFDILLYGSSLVPDGTNIAFDAAGHPVSINSVTFTLNENQVPGTGFQVIGGATGLLTASGLVNPGDNITLVVQVYDISDHIYDSAVLLDNVRFSTQGGGGILGNIGLTPSSLAMLPGNTANVIVSLTNLAPAGGLTVHLSSTLPSVANVSPQTVFIPAGSNQGATPVVVSAVGLGVATVVATGTNFENGTAEVRVGTDLYVFENDIAINPQGTSYQISATIHNRGLSTNSIEVKFLEQNLENNLQHQIGSTETIANLGVNNQTTLLKSYNPASANTMVIVVVDPRNQIPESNEQNNSAAKRFTSAKPSVQSVTARFDGNPDPNIFGRFIRGLSNTQNTFYATISGNVSKVKFSIGGTIVEDTDGSNGWSATFDMGSLPAGNDVLTVTAVAPSGIGSAPVTKIIQVSELPIWITANLTLWDILRIDIDQSHLSFALKFNVPTSAQGGPFSYIARINNDVMFIPHDAIEAESQLELSVGIPLDATLGWQIGGTLTLSQSVLGHEVGSRAVSLAVVLNADYSLNSILASLETEALLFGVEVRLNYPLVPGIDAVIGGGFDLFGHLKLQVVAGLVNNQVKFVVAPTGEVTEIQPGLGLRFNLIGGLEIIFGLVSGELVISPRFDINLDLQYVSPPLGTGFNLTTSGEGSVEWRVVGSVFWGWVEEEIASGVFGPWPIFGPNMLTPRHPIAMRIDTVQLPTTLPLPSISADSNGHVMIAWLQKDNTTDSPPQIYYSFKTDSGSFSLPQPLVSNNRYKSDPKVVFNHDGSASAVFVQNSQPKGFELGHPSLAEILKYQDIYYTKWNGTSWLAPILVSSEVVGSERSDGVPAIAVSRDGSEKLILWTRNVLANSLDRHGLKIFYSRGVNDVLGPLTALTSGNTASDLMVRACYYSDSSAVAIWVRDLDGNPATSFDAEVYYSRWQSGAWSTPHPITSNPDQEKDLSAVALHDGRVVATWVQTTINTDSTMQYSLMSSTYTPGTDTWSTPELVYTHHHFIETPSVQVDRRYIVTITWRGYHRNINGDILITAKDFSRVGTQWSPPRSLTDDVLIDWMMATTIDASNNQYFVNLKSMTSDSTMANIPPSKRSNFYGGLSVMAKGIKPNGLISDDLNIGTYALASDLSVDSTQITVVDSVLRVGHPSQVTVNIKNVGLTDSDTSRVRVFNKPPIQGGIPIVSDQLLPKLRPDSTYTFQFMSQFTDTSGVFVSVDPDNKLKEQSKANNTAFRRFVLLPDITVQTLSNSFSGAPRIGQAGTIATVLKNSGSKNAQNILLRFSRSKVDSIQSSTVFKDTVLSNMNFDNLYWVSLPYVVNQTGPTFLFLNIDPLGSIAENSKSNNTGVSSFQVLPDLRIDSVWYDEDAHRLSAIIRNVGGDTAKTFSVHFSRGNPLNGGAFIDSLTHTALLVDRVDTVSTIRGVPAGLQYLFVWLDRGNTIKELSKDNNFAFTSVLSPGSVDLTARIVKVDSTVTTGQPSRVFFAVQNIGTSGCNSIQYSVFDYNNVSMKSGIVSILNPNESYVDTVSVILSDSLMSSIKIEVDPDNSIIESDETNNTIIGLVGAFPVHGGWNIISVPVATADTSAFALFPAAASNAFGYNGTYFVASRLYAGQGYWLKFNLGATYAVFGSEVTPKHIPVAGGWNMVGPFDLNARVAGITSTPPGIIQTPFYGYNSGYSVADTLKIGKGYWVKVSQNGTLHLSTTLAKIAEAAHQAFDDWLKVELEDNTGAKGFLFLARRDQMKGSYELPPIAPSGVLDLRFSNNAFVEQLGTGRHELQLNSALYPVQLRAFNLNGWVLNVRDGVNGRLLNELLDEGRSITISQNLSRLILYESNAKPEIPTSFELSQNYPNPFNPVTVIRFALPKDSPVKLSVYSLLGGKVAELVNGNYEAGYHQVEFNAKEYASGVYMYKLEAGNFVQVKKMIVLR